MPDSEGLFSKTPIEVKLEAEITCLRASLAEAERERDGLRPAVAEIERDEAIARAERAEAELAEAEKKLAILEDSESCETIILRTKLAEAERERDVLRENVKEILEDEKCSLNQCVLEYRFNEAYANADSRAERAEANLALARSIMSIRDLNRLDILLKERERDVWSNWQPIKTAPRDRYILLFSNDPLCDGDMEVGRWYGDDGGCWWSWGGPNGGLELDPGRVRNFSDWMELPQPPAPSLTKVEEETK